jgi:hypothetical protein
VTVIDVCYFYKKIPKDDQNDMNEKIDKSFEERLKRGEQ